MGRNKKDLKYMKWISEHDCCVCGKGFNIQVHHEPPKKMGGGNSTDRDTVPLCVSCHNVRHGIYDENYFTENNRYKKHLTMDFKRAMIQKEKLIIIEISLETKKIMRDAYESQH